METDELREIEVNRDSSGWKLVRMYDIRYGEQFRFVDTPSKIWRAASEPYRQDDGVWGILADPPRSTQPTP
jgi:hypothetical protein